MSPLHCFDLKLIYIWRVDLHTELSCRKRPYRKALHITVFYNTCKYMTLTNVFCFLNASLVDRSDRNEPV